MCPAIKAGERGLPAWDLPTGRVNAGQIVWKESNGRIRIPDHP